VVIELRGYASPKIYEMLLKASEMRDFPSTVINCALHDKQQRNFFQPKLIFVPHGVGFSERERERERDRQTEKK